MSAAGNALWSAVLLLCVVAPAMGKSAQLPDWSGQWENVGETPDASGGFEQSLAEVLQLSKSWGPPPYKPEFKAKMDQDRAAEQKSQEQTRANGPRPDPKLHSACTFGFPQVMIGSPLMFEVLATTKETAIIFSGREIRHVYTDGRPHTAKEDLWPTPWGDSIGHWLGQTLVIDTIMVRSPFVPAGTAFIPVVAFGGDGDDSQLIAVFSSQAHFVEQIRMIDKDHLEDRMTIIDPGVFTVPWHIHRTYQRVTRIHRMVYEDCEGEDRNPVVNGLYTLAPPPPAPGPLPPPAAPDAPGKTKP